MAPTLGIKPTGKVCKAAQGLLAEAEEHLEEVAPGPVLDTAIIICARKNEHYEICSYGTLILWVTQLGLTDVIDIFQKTLTQEEGANEALAEVAGTSAPIRSRDHRKHKKRSFGEVVMN